MEEIQAKTGKFAMKYGLILGIVAVVFGIMLYTQDLHYQNDWPIVVINIVLSAGFMAFAIIQFKKANGGFISISEALKVGVGVALISSIIGLIYYAVLSNVLDPEFIRKSTEYRLQDSIANGTISQDQLDIQLKAAKDFAWIGYPVQLVIGLLFGLVVSLIVGLIVKKKKDQGI